VLVLPGLGKNDSVACPSTLRGPRVGGGEAGSVGGKKPGGVRVLLANPRWERRFVRFLELPGVGRIIANGTDEEAAHAARMDEWIV